MTTNKLAQGRMRRDFMLQDKLAKIRAFGERRELTMAAKPTRGRKEEELAGEEEDRWRRGRRHGRRGKRKGRGTTEDGKEEDEEKGDDEKGRDSF